MSPPLEPLEVEVQVRYRSHPEMAWLVPMPLPSGIKDPDVNRVELSFSTPQFSLAPGQAAVFYAGDVLLGGGLIEI